ncbi:FAD-dependent oxidoreductase [Streptomyces sp. NPDC052396]|uniref:FAD-dependent oxidoreductase n=1 Tax=Streptomyces sp. NPDC052396 TaxID=3365689 RepID=UPI0037CD5885
MLTRPAHRAPDRRAVVIGSGLAGMLTAAALADHAQVTLLERDRLPEAPAPRKGLPQARHAHLLWSGGVRAIEGILPGITEHWIRAGARRIPLPTGLVSLSAQGWLRRWPEMQYLIACSRDLLDSVVREQILHLDITARDGVEAVGLIGSPRNVTGVRIRNVATGQLEDLDADLVVDAGGRGSAAPKWLAGLGIPAPHEKTVDSGLTYATRVFRAPVGTDNFPVVNVQADARQPVPGRTATLVPIENGRWLVTLSGTRGGNPPKDNAQFEQFARSEVRHPIVADLIAAAEPLTDVQVTHSTVNRRRHFEQLGSWPAGFIVLGDAVATYNPIYGQGMSVAAQSAAALRDAVRSRGLGDRNLARVIQKAIGRLVKGPWELATGQDILYPGAVGPQPPVAARLLRGYMDRLMRTATGRAATCHALLDTMTLSAPISRLLAPTVAIGVLRGPRLDPPAEPPLTAAEMKRAGLGLPSTA